MNIKTFKAVSKLIGANAEDKVSTAILIKGCHGIGKSQIINQIAKELGMECVTFMCSQVADVGDVIGLPSIKHYKVNVATGEETEIQESEIVALDRTKYSHISRTVFNPPYWYKADKPVVLFFDEINRARKEISNALMQITLEHKILNFSLPKGTRIFAAINPNDSGEYDVEDMDPAKYDRFAVYDLVPSPQEWLEFAEAEGIHPCIINYISKNHSDLDPYSNQQLVKVANSGGNNVLPSRRSWHQLSDVLKNGDKEHLFDGKEGKKFLIELVSGYVGNATAVNFAAAYNLDDGVDIEKMLTKFTKTHKAKLAAMDAPAATKLVNSVRNLIKDGSINVDENVSENFYNILTSFRKDIQVALVQNVIFEAVEKMEDWIGKLNNRKLNDYFASVISMSAMV